MAESYNGWKNWATWNVALWLGNDEGLYNSVRAMASSTLKRTGAKKITGDMAKEIVTELLPKTPDMETKNEMRGVHWISIARTINDWA